MVQKILCAVLLLANVPAAATFSISACLPDGSCGVAVATNNLAVGASVAYARAGVGAVATQFETNPGYGPRGLDLLAAGRSAQDTLAQLLAGDGNFEGLGIDYRQVAIVAMPGAPAVYSGKEALASAWAGTRSGANYAIAGNGLAGANVLAAMETAFAHTGGELAARLLAALEAGELSGGQTTGRMSAALLVRTLAGGFADVDLRVDAAARPVPELRRLFDLRRAHATMLAAERAARASRAAEANQLVREALRLGDSWDRIWRRAARVAMSLHDPDSALRFLRGFRARNAAWAALEIDDSLYAPLRENAELDAWRAPPATAHKGD
jgi:uncharacterized Ntn-hydrolase superfamily protein